MILPAATPLPFKNTNRFQRVFSMKLLLPILAGLALVACKGEPDAQTDGGSGVETPAAAAKTVSLSISGMT